MPENIYKIEVETNVVIVQMDTEGGLLWLPIHVKFLYCRCGGY